MAAGVIARHEGPAEWRHPLVVVPKKLGDVRLCIDFTKLNRFVRRSSHPVLSASEAMAKVPHRAKYFSVMDATAGYHQVELAEESQLLTVFATPWGNFKFLRAPMGLSSAGDEFGARTDWIFDDTTAIKVVDDLLVATETRGGHIRDVFDILWRCRETGLSISPDKFKFGEKCVDFVGFRVGEKGVEADPTKIEAITKFPKPKSRTDVKAFMGLANQLAAFTNRLAEMSLPLRELMKSKNAFFWDQEHEKAFDAVKQLLVSPPILAKFDPNAATTLHTDASRLHGLGFLVMQRQEGEDRLIQCGSRYLSDTETRYSMPELELLGVAWAAHKAKFILMGQTKIRLVVDHEPLIPMVNDYTIDKATSPRLRRLLERLQFFNFEAEWKAGRLHVAPDALSRNPVDHPSRDDLLAEEDADDAARHVIVANIETARASGMPDMQLNKMRAKAGQCNEYKELLAAVANDFKDEETISSETKKYLKMRNDMSVVDGLAYNKDRMVVPKPARQEVLRALHASHSGMSKSKAAARACMYWPGMSTDVEKYVSQCDRCRPLLPSQPKEELVQTDCAALFPFEHVSVDLFAASGRTYLAYADRRTGWLEIAEWRTDPNAGQVIDAMRKFFTALGVPAMVSSDNGPQFASIEYRNFLDRWNVTARYSSPYHPQSNGHAEAAVKVLKKLVLTSSASIASEEFQKGLLQLRNEPLHDGRSPAEHLFGHKLRSLVPARRNAFSPEWQALANGRIKAVMQKTKAYYDKSAHSLRPLRVGQTVAIQNTKGRWEETGVIVEKNSDRSYYVQTSGREARRRNRKQLRPVTVAAPDNPPRTPPPSAATNATPRTTPPPPPTNGAEAATRLPARTRRVPKRFLD